MKVNPISETEAVAFGLFKRGAYDFEVLEAVEKSSKAGNPMIELLVAVHDTEGHSRKLNDWLVESEATAFKIRHFAAAVGLLPQYIKGEIKAHDLIGKTGRCQLTIKKDKTGAFPDKNAISDYLPPGQGPLIASVADPELDDEIPF